MHRCLYLAALARERVFPNPMVGAVLVHNNRIIGEGYHEAFGGPHAEVNAIQRVNNPNLLPLSTLYVNLEPCSHFGKTPPCTNLILASGIPEVVIGTPDPNPLVAGKGIEILESAGIKVRVGISEAACRLLNQRFFNHVLPNGIKTRFTLKWAESKDGFMGKPHYGIPEDRNLSNEAVRRWVHQIRSNSDAVMTGTNTIRIDNPRLDNRFWYGKPAHAVFIDRNLSLSKNLDVFRHPGKVFVLNALKDEVEGKIHYLRIHFEPNPRAFWKEVSEKLSSEGIEEVLLEGGANTLNSFLQSGLPCTIYRIRTPKVLGTGIPAPQTGLNGMNAFDLSDNKIEVYRKDAG